MSFIHSPSHIQPTALYAVLFALLIHILGIIILTDAYHCTEILMDEMLHRVPALEEAEVRQMVNGAESFTPDAHPILGEAPEVVTSPCVHHCLLCPY